MRSPEIDFYIANADPSVQSRLHEIRALISELVPEASEKMSYKMPTFYLNGNLVHFAIFPNHLGFYPGPSGVAFVADELKAAGYKFAKGSIQFPLNQPLPVELIRKIVCMRVTENSKK